MKPTLALTALDAVQAPHRGGHRCDGAGGKWFNEHTGTRTPCPVALHLATAREQIERLHAQVHEAAHHTPAAEHVAEAMTGFTLSELAAEDREGWTLSARLAIEGLAEWLDRDPAVEARAAAVRARLEAAGLTPDPPPFPEHPANTHTNAPWEAP